MTLPCETEDCDGEVPYGWHLDGEISACPECGRNYRVWGDETYNSETAECFDWWALTEPEGENPW